MINTKKVSVCFWAMALLLSGMSGAGAQSVGASVITSETNLFSPKGPEPDINSVPALQRLVQRGAKLYHLGQRSGIHGWFIVKDGQVQMIYLSPDRKTVMIGALLSNDGENVTRAQVRYLMGKNKKLSEMLAKSGKAFGAINKGGAPGGVASVPSNPNASKTQPKGSAIPSVSLSPGESLIQDLEASAGVILGKNENAQIYMIVAPSCPVCKATWKELRAPVNAGSVEVRLIPVFNSEGEKEIHQSAQLLKAKDPLKVWNKFVDGDEAALAGKPDAGAVRAIASNLNLMSKWNIQNFPYLVYRGKNGRIKIVQGKPERMASILLDLSK